MPAMKRRPRKLDTLASPEAVRAICLQLRSRCSQLTFLSEQRLLRFLYAVQHTERYSASDTKRGRHAQWSREELTAAASALRGILERETAGRVSVSRFISQYLQVLRFPADVVVALSSGSLNLEESLQLSRVTAERLGCAPATARQRRQELLRAHVAVHGSQNALRRRVQELLGETKAPGVNTESMVQVVADVDELLKIDPTDSRHLFWEEMKTVFYALREVRLEDVDDVLLDEMLSAMTPLRTVIHKIERRRRTRDQQQKIAL